MKNSDCDDRGSASGASHTIHAFDLRLHWGGKDQRKIFSGILHLELKSLFLYLTATSHRIRTQ